MDSREKSILKTLLYADLFDYPLTKEEIFKFLISKKSVSHSEIAEVLKNSHLPIEKAKGYFYIKGRQALVGKRERREKVSVAKLSRAKEIIKKIGFIPSIKLVGVSGALSMRNSDEDDDIDLFVITKKELAWTTRLLLTVLLSVFGVYRNRQSKNFSNKICLNLILDENRIDLSQSSRDLYTAHEIVQLLPILNKENTYQAFIKQNIWVKNYIPNFIISKNASSYKTTFFAELLLVQMLKIIKVEKIAKFLQLKYMEGHITNEITEDGFLKFHPFDYKTYVLEKYKRRLLKYDL